MGNTDFLLRNMTSLLTLKHSCLPFRYLTVVFFISLLNDFVFICSLEVSYSYLFIEENE